MLNHLPYNESRFGATTAQTCATLRLELREKLYQRALRSDTFYDQRCALRIDKKTDPKKDLNFFLFFADLCFKIYPLYLCLQNYRLM